MGIHGDIISKAAKLFMILRPIFVLTLRASAASGTVPDMLLSAQMESSVNRVEDRALVASMVVILERYIRHELIVEPSYA